MDLKHVVQLPKRRLDCLSEVELKELKLYINMKDRSLCLCVDYSTLKKNASELLPLLLILEMLGHVRKARVFTKTDQLRGAFNLIRIKAVVYERST